MRALRQSVMPDSPVPADNRERLALIQRLWLQLDENTRPGTKEHAALTARIRKETDAFRAALDHDDPTKF
jgi:hypothetical protein